jgi:hypothetical protein
MLCDTLQRSREIRLPKDVTAFEARPFGRKTFKRLGQNESVFSQFNSRLQYLCPFRTVDVRGTTTHSCAYPASTTSPRLPPTLAQLFASPHTLPLCLFRARSQSSCEPNCRSNPIAHRVRRKRQRLPPSLLIENAPGRACSRPKVSVRGVSDQG